MRKAKPIITLFLIIGLPLVIFFVLDSGTHNKENLSILSPKYPDPGGGPDSVFQVVGDFALTNQTGESITKNDFKGKILVFHAFNTDCIGECPTISTNLKEVQQYLEEAEDSSVVMLTVSTDPVRDSVSRLRDFADQYGLIDSRWMATRGNKAEVDRLLYQDLFFSLPADSSETALPDETLRIVDKEGRIRGKFYRGNSEDEVRSLIDDVKLLKFEYERNQE